MIIKKNCILLISCRLLFIKGLHGPNTANVWQTIWEGYLDVQSNKLRRHPDALVAQGENNDWRNMAQEFKLLREPHDFVKFIRAMSG
jgi:hypothetical protein